MINIYNEDCVLTMQNRIEKHSIDVVITSPPYNNSRTSHTDYCMKTSNCRYAEYNDNKTNSEYCNWICDIFNNFNRIVKKDGVVCWNVSYGSENPTVMFDCIYQICNSTDWMIADMICWKKQSALPNNVSSNKLTRICEPIFIFCRKDEYDTFYSNKEVSSYSKTGQPFYTVMYNWIEAKNNDGPNDLNKATFSVSLVTQLIDMYVKKSQQNSTVYDCFMGTGTTAVGCKMRGINCIGSEISEQQCTLANNRINNTQQDLW